MTGVAAPVAQPIPFSASFETYGNGIPIANGTPVQALTNDGWDASDPAVVVQTNVVWSGTNAVLVPGNMMVSNAVTPAVATNVWTECHWCMVPPAVADVPIVHSSAVVDLNLAAGYLQAYNGVNGWLPLTNTVWGDAVPAVTNGQWVRVTVFQNYVSHQCAIFQDGKLLAQVFPFVSNVNSCSSFRLEGGDLVDSYLDDVSIGLAIPAALTNDWNNDGIPDAQEIATYGYLALTLSVGPGQTYTTIQAAVNAALPRNSINVAPGTYTENVFLAQSLAGLTGTAFAVNGSFGIGPGVVQRVSGLTSCGNLGVSSAANLYLTGALSASNVTVGVGGVLTGTAFTVNGAFNMDTGAVVIAGSLTNSGDLSIGPTGSLSVAGALSASNVTIGARGILTAGVFTVNGALGIGSGAVVGASSLACSGNLSIGPTGSLSVAGALSASNVTIGAGGMLTAGVFTVNGALSLGPGAVVGASALTCSGDLSVSNAARLTVAGAVSANNVSLASGAVVSVGGSLTASSLALASGSSLTVSGGLSVTGSVSVSPSASLTVNGPLIGQGVDVSGTLAISSGSTLTCTNLSVNNGTALYLTNVTVTAGTLTIGAGSTVVVVNGTVIVNGMTLTGSFTLDQNWGNQGASCFLPYSDNFEAYPVGTAMNALGFRGWGATDNSVMIETNQAFNSLNGVVVGNGSALSNRANSASASQVWTDFRSILCYNANDQTSSVPTGVAFKMVVSSNGYLSVYNAQNGAWEECRKDVWGNTVASLGTAEWVRISVCNNYATKQCALFLRGVLMRQRLPFINASLTSYSVATLDNNEFNPAYLDDVYIGAAYPPTLTDDVNSNGVPDAQEIAVTGDVFTRGSVFILR